MSVAQVPPDGGGTNGANRISHSSPNWISMPTSNHHNSELTTNTNSSNNTITTTNMLAAKIRQKGEQQTTQTESSSDLSIDAESNLVHTFTSPPMSPPASAPAPLQIPIHARRASLPKLQPPEPSSRVTHSTTSPVLALSSPLASQPAAASVGSTSPPIAAAAPSTTTSPVTMLPSPPSAASASAATARSVVRTRSPIKILSSSNTTTTTNAQQQHGNATTANHPPRYAFPIFKPDGDVATSYINQQHVARKRRVAVYIMIFAFAYVLLEIPYLLNDHWTIQRNFIPIILRIFNALIIYIGVLLNRRLYVARFITHTTERFDAMVCALMCISAVLLCVMETQRQWKTEYELVSGVESPTHLSAVDSLLEDGVLLGLSLIYTFTCGVAKLRWIFVGLLGLVGMITWIVTILVVGHRSERYLVLSIIYQFILLLALLLVSLRTEKYKSEILNKQKLQFLERKKAEKLLRSMLPTRILSDYLDGSIGQLQSNATIGFLQIHLGGSDTIEKLMNCPPGSHQPTLPQAINASPGELMQKLHDTFKRVDGIVNMYAIRGVNKIETVATTYLLCAGLLQDIDDHAAAMIDVSLEILSMVTTRLNIGGAAKRIPVLMRIGISSGPVVGGIIGAQRRFFRVFGDTVNVAARMCTNVSMGRIQISPSCYAALSERQRAAYKIPPGRTIDIKGKGEMVCYLVEPRADFVAKFNKSNMNRGQQDRADEPLLNKSFVYHKLMKRTDLGRWDLLFKQERGAGYSLEKQATFVRQARSNSTGMQSMHHPPHQHSHLQSHPERQISAASLLDRVHGNNPKRDGSPVMNGTPRSLRHTSSMHATQGADGHSNVLAPAAAAAAPGSGVEEMLQRVASASSVKRPSSAFPPLPLPPHAAGHSRLRARSSAQALGLYSQSQMHPSHAGDGAGSNGTQQKVRSEPSPFDSDQIELFFQLSYAKAILPDLRWATFISACFQAGILIYVVEHHPSATPPSTQDWNGSVASASPTAMIATSLTLFLLFDFLSLFHVISSAFWRCWHCDQDFQNDDTSNASNSFGDKDDSPRAPAPMSGSGLVSPTSPDAILKQVLKPEHERRASAGIVAPVRSSGSGGPSHFARHLQAYTLLFTILLNAWVLIALDLWGLNISTEIHPVFALILVQAYSCFFLRLQFRLLGPLAILSWICFALIMIIQGYSIEACLLFLSHLFCGLIITLWILYYFEKSLRSNFLQAYALEKEQEYMDQFLNNLLPKDVVLVLKKQNPALAKEVVGVHSSSTPTPATGHRGSRVPGAPMSIDQGGVASRFAMHFPRTTVFESDIVGYTEMVSFMTPADTLNLLNMIFSRFDSCAFELGVEKIETIGDAFMCMVFDGPPDPVLDFALLIVGVLAACNLETHPRRDLQIRMGICSGSCFGGIVGTEIPRFHLFGNCVDAAIRIEQNGRAGDIIVSSSTYILSQDRYDYSPLDLVVDDSKTFLLQSKKPESPLTPILSAVSPQQPDAASDQHFVRILPEPALNSKQHKNPSSSTAEGQNAPASSRSLRNPSVELIRTQPSSEQGGGVLPANKHNSPGSMTTHVGGGSTTTSVNTSSFALATSSSTASAQEGFGGHHRATNSRDDRVSTFVPPTDRASTMSVHTSVSAVASLPEDQHLVITNQQFIDPATLES